MRLSEDVLLAFQDELDKVALVNPIIGSAATLGVGGALAGGGLGYLRAKMQGQEGAEALKSMGRGALVGGGAGAAGGAGLAALAPRVGGAVSRFGQRELHGLTGWKPEGGLHAIRGGAYDAREGVQEARKALTSAQSAAKTNFDPVVALQHQKSIAGAEKGLTSALERRQAAVKAEEMGLTSIPGMLKSVKQHGLMPTLGAATDVAIKGQHPAMAAAQVGLPLAFAAHEAVRHRPEGTEGSRAEAIGSNIGQGIGGVIGMPLPVVGSTMIGEGLGRVGRLVGKGVNKLQGVVRKHTELPMPDPSSNGQNTPTERVHSDRAMGYAPETIG